MTAVIRRNALVIVLVVLVGSALWVALPPIIRNSFSFDLFVQLGIGVAGSLITVSGIGRESRHAGREREIAARPPTDADEPPPPIETPFRLPPDFESGLYGGVIGGAAAGLLIGTVYYLDARGDAFFRQHVQAWIIPAVTLFAALAGAGAGAFIRLVSAWLAHVARERGAPKLLFNEVTGGALGGALGGVPFGALGLVLFGQLCDWPFPSPAIIIPFGAVGITFIILGILVYDFKGQWRYLIRAVMLSSLVSAFLATMGAFLVSRPPFYCDVPLSRVTGGALFGIEVGVVWGLQAGLTLFLFHLWQRASSEPAPA